MDWWHWVLAQTQVSRNLSLLKPGFLTSKLEDDHPCKTGPVYMYLDVLVATQLSSVDILAIYILSRRLRWRPRDSYIHCASVLVPVLGCAYIAANWLLQMFLMCCFPLAGLTLVYQKTDFWQKDGSSAGVTTGSSYVFVLQKRPGHISMTQWPPFQDSLPSFWSVALCGFPATCFKRRRNQTCSYNSVYIYIYNLYIYIHIVHISQSLTTLVIIETTTETVSITLKPWGICLPCISFFWISGGNSQATSHWAGMCWRGWAYLNELVVDEHAEQKGPGCQCNGRVLWFFVIPWCWSCNRWVHKFHFAMNAMFYQLINTRFV